MNKKIKTRTTLSITTDSISIDMISSLCASMRNVSVR